ncbi:MAG: alpha/beta hydrolase [Nitrospirae bacterium]|nr:alpha/beta hydrolase [Nitrospirota bacterium]MDA1303159.1 alpha/beta hydrolase [Nitrospirota bacterium]
MFGVESLFSPSMISLSSIGIFTWLVNFFAFHPHPGNQVVPHLVDPTIQEVFFNAADGVTLQAFFVPRPDSDRVVLFLHGNAGNASHRLEDAVHLASLGTNVFLLSYRGYGKSEGSPSEQGVYTDGRSALTFIQSELGFTVDRTVIFGRSIGSAVAIEIAQGLSVAGLVLVSPFSSGRDFARAQGLFWIAWVMGEPFNSIEKISRVTAPVLFLHGDQDDIVPIDLGRKLFEQCRSPKTWKSIPGAGHNDLIQRAGTKYWEGIQEFMDSVAPF